MKSIRTDNIKVTAEQLGAKIGDKFIILDPEDSYAYKHSTLEAGSILELIQADESSYSSFRCVTSNEKTFEHFGCLARYEKQKEEEIVLDKVKFDMKAIAEENGISLKAAHELVQGMLFEAGNKWAGGKDGKDVKYENSEWLFVAYGSITYDDYDSDSTYAQLKLELKKSFVVKKKGPPEVIEVDGHKYVLVK